MTTTPHTDQPEPEECPTIDKLRDFALSRLSREEVERIQSHLSSCSQCSGFLLAMPETSEFIKDAAHADSPDDHSRITEEAGPPGGRRTEEREAGQPAPVRGLRLGRYLIRQLLGKGGFGIVYLAWDEDLERLVAIKVPYSQSLTSSELQVYHTEARLHASLDHPNILPIYDVGRTDQVPFFLVSKFIKGENLSDRIRRDRPGLREAADLVALLALALTHMHDRGLIHRDIKPRNILIDADGTPYLADFGLAIRPVFSAASDRNQPRVAGTPAYMSPEQARGDSDRVDSRSDIYSLGVVLYELLTGVRPFQGNALELRQQILNNEPTSLRRLAPEVPKSLEAICLMAMAKDPERRYQRGDDLAEDLGLFLKGEPLRHAEKPSLAGRAQAWLQRNLAVTLLGCLALFALFLAAHFGLRNAPTPPPGETQILTTLQTDPPGASLYFFPLDPGTGAPQPQHRMQTNAGDEVRLAPGDYLVVAVLPRKNGEEQRFHEVYRRVPGAPGTVAGPFRHNNSTTIDGVVHLPLITIPPVDVVKEMCLFPGAKDFRMGAGESPKQLRDILQPHRRSLPAFYLDTTEVTTIPYRRWLLAPKFDAKVESNNLFPAVGVTWDHAVAFAEKMGKRLPEETEYEYAATACGKQRFPWGNSDEPLRRQEWTLAPVGQHAFDRLDLPGQPPVFGLYSNVAEWTSSWAGDYPGMNRLDPPKMLRVVKGGPLSVIEGNRLINPILGPGERISLSIPTTKPGLGFRCARSAKPRLTANDFVTILDR